VSGQGVKAFSDAMNKLGGPDYIGQTQYMLWRQLEELTNGDGSLLGLVTRCVYMCSACSFVIRKRWVAI
jgi:hypothetical protein